MGLDIDAYEVVELVHACSVGEHEHSRVVEYEGKRYGDGLVFLYSDDWPERADGLVDGAYHVSGEHYRFRAGSYSGYNRWREELAALVGTTPEALWAPAVLELAEATPFYELIRFSDCEGIIGPKTSAKLVKDFAAWEARAVEHRPNSMEVWHREWFLEGYRSWKKAFEVAAGRGCVTFG